MQTRLIPTLILFGLVLSAAAALAERSPGVTPVSTAGITRLGAQQAGDCLIGNLETPAHSVADWLDGSESYKYRFDPRVEGCCDTGFRLETVHVLVEFVAGVHPLPQTFSVYAGMDPAEPVEGRDCLWPASTFGLGPLVQFTISEPGVYDLALPLGLDCAYIQYDYFMSVYFPDPIAAALVTDATPTPCLVLGNWGVTGWQDLQDWGFDAYGDLVIYADVVCCEDPLAPQAPSWGGIKTLYR